jgi:hypothetical protein
MNDTKQQVTASIPDSDALVIITPGTTNPGYIGNRVCVESSKAFFAQGTREWAIIDLNCKRRETENQGTFGGYDMVHNTPYDVKRSIASNPNSDWTFDVNKQLSNAVISPSSAPDPTSAKAWIDALPVPNEVAKPTQSQPKGEGKAMKALEQRQAAEEAAKAKSKGRK